MKQLYTEEKYLIIAVLHSIPIEVCEKFGLSKSSHASEMVVCEDITDSYDLAFRKSMETAESTFDADYYNVYYPDGTEIKVEIVDGYYAIIATEYEGDNILNSYVLDSFHVVPC